MRKMTCWSKRFTGFVLGGLLIAGMSGTANATPSTHIWAPSTDVQPFKVVHLTHDVYIPVGDESGSVPPATNLGLEVGILPFKTLNAEVGFDLIHIGGSADANPIAYNVKLGIPEGALMSGSPALAVGSYLLGGKKDVSDANVVYGKVAKTFGNFGRLSVGYYSGNDTILVDTAPAVADVSEEAGVLAAWEKTVTEVSDKLWVCIEYMGGDNYLGTTNIGFAWTFTPNISMIFGYDMLNNRDLVGNGFADTFTTQLDLNF